MPYRSITAWVVVLAVLPGYLAGGGILPAPDEPAQVAKTWIAVDGYSVVRLSLKNDGTGALAINLAKGPPSVYRIRSWRLDQETRYVNGVVDSLRSMPLDLEPVGQAQPRMVTGWAGRTTIRLDVSGWGRPVWLSPEQEVEDRIRRTREGMATK
ncbi:MAG: hypothetical protein NT031_08865 [Planctomycetota bacterium]|nr:hypothetical protein [Planctomycetota bacterium]